MCLIYETDKYTCTCTRCLYSRLTCSCGTRVLKLGLYAKNDVVLQVAKIVLVRDVQIQVQVNYCSRSRIYRQEVHVPGTSTSTQYTGNGWMMGWHRGA
jgi:hypothetical protein